MLGGDHSLAAGSVAATSDFVRREGKPLGLIWIDAHGDMNTPASSVSGNVHGMPLASLLGPEPAELSRLGGFSPKVAPSTPFSSASATSTLVRRKSFVPPAFTSSR